MRILILHNRYQIGGGEDGVVDSEVALLRKNGQEVLHHEENNQDLTGLFAKVKAFFSCIYSRSSQKRIENLIVEFSPDVIHVHNFFPKLSPAIYYAAKNKKIPMVQTLHNFRLTCANALLMRDNRICEDCLGKKFPWPGIVHKCYRESALGSAAIATMIGVHHILGTWQECVDAYLVPSEFGKEKLIEAGLPREKVLFKPNFSSLDLGQGHGSGKFALFVGRLSIEKGIQTLLSAWENETNIPLKIVGDGPLLGQVEELCARNPAVTYLGRQSKESVSRLMREAECLVFPSIWYEMAPLVIIEALSAGLPIIASNIGSTPKVINPNQQPAGMVYKPGSAVELKESVAKLFALAEEEKKIFRKNARSIFTEYYTEEKNFYLLISIYENLLKKHKERINSLVQS